jgi:excinuclease ABC subunit C
MASSKVLAQAKKTPLLPGVYIMKDSKGKVLYVGKAAHLRKRVLSYFTRAHDSRLELLMQKVAKIETEVTGSVVEALVREAELIKKNQPPFNILEKDDKSFLYVVITKEEWPRLLLVRGKDLAGKEKARSVFGPFTSASQLKVALKIIRRIFPWNTHLSDKIGSYKRPCFDYEIGQCPGTCVGRIGRKDYLKEVKHLELFFKGEKHRLIISMEKDMEQASKLMEFERAEKLKRQMFALRHIEDVALISEDAVDQSGKPKQRIEGYDISNISGDSAVGSMVVFRGDKPDKSQYRKFKIEKIRTSDDVGMLTEMLTRRFKRSSAASSGGEWPLPDLVLVDGGKPQVNAAQKVMDMFGLRVPLVGLAKGPERKRNDLFGTLPKGIEFSTLIKVRDEAHRFAISYHKKVRARKFLSGNK